MKCKFIKIGFLLYLITGNYFSYSQEKVKFGYFNKKHKIVVDTLKQTNSINNTKKDTSISILQQLFSNDIKQSDTIVISVLLPFYTKLNDSLQSKLKNSINNSNQVYIKSELPIKMLEGILLATDSLSKTGKCIRVSVFDTENNKTIVNKLLNSDTLNSSNIIFGPLYSENFKVVSKYYHTNKSIVLINPLSSHIDLLRRKPNVYSLNPSEKIIRDYICSFTIKNREKKEIVIFSLSDNISHGKYIKSKINIKLIPVKHKIFSDLNQITSELLMSELKEENMIIIPSSDIAFVTKMIALLGTLDKKMMIIGLNQWASFNELNIETLMKLNVNILSTFYFNSENIENKKLQLKFEKKYSHKFDKFSLIAYKSIFHFCSKDYFFDFQKFSKMNGSVNVNVKMLHYSDYKLIPLE